MTALGTPFNSVWYKPNDTPAKGCTVENGIPPGYSVTRPSLDAQISTDATALSALPGGSSVLRFLSFPEGYTGIASLGHVFSATDPTGRVALRWYRYYSPNFIFSDEGPGWNNSTGAGCHASKIAQGQYNAIVDAHGDTQIAQYGYLASPGWNPSLDCCGSGPVCADGDSTCKNLMATLTPRGTGWLNPNSCNYGSTQGGNPTSGNCGWAGAWIRFEYIIGHRDGTPGNYYLLYVKNVTHNSPEYLVLDTRVAGSNFAQNWSTAAATALTPPGRVDGISVNAYRQNTCAGWSGFAYMMAAAWASDGGQRIGPAVEVESGGGALAATSGLTVK
jgi:hypothetical protein